MTELGLKHLIGSPLLRGYMHGFFVSQTLYQRVKAIARPFEYAEWRKQKVKEKVAAQAQSRIGFKEHALLPEVNREVAQRLLVKEKKAVKSKQKDGLDVGKRSKKKVKLQQREQQQQEQQRQQLQQKRQERREEGAVSARNPLGDDRFRAMFESKDFQVDKDSEEYKIRFPNGERQVVMKAAGGDRDAGDCSNVGSGFNADDSGSEAMWSAFGIGASARRFGRGWGGDFGDGGYGDSGDEYDYDSNDEGAGVVGSYRSSRMGGRSKGGHEGRTGGFSDEEEDGGGDDEDDMNEEMPYVTAGWAEKARKEMKRGGEEGDGGDKEPADMGRRFCDEKKSASRNKIKHTIEQKTSAGGDKVYAIASGGGIGLFIGSSEDQAKQSLVMESRARPIGERI